MLFSFLLSLRIAVILEKNQNQSFALRQIRKRLLILILYKNIDIPPKSPFGKGGLGRFAPGAQIFRVSWLRSTANAVKIANN